MNSSVVRRLFLIVLLFNAADLNAVQRKSLSIDSSGVEKNSQRAQTQDIAGRVKKAFGAVRKGRGQDELDELSGLGAKVVPHLKPYLNDVNLNVRRETVRLAMDIGAAESLNLAASALRNSVPEIRRLTAEILYDLHRQYKEQIVSREYPLILARYENFSAENLSANAELKTGLQNSIETGNKSRHAIFLLANFPGRETEEILNDLSEDTAARPAKKRTVSKETRLAARVILANAGQQKAVRFFSEAVEKNNLETSKFLLENLIEVESKEVLAALLKTFDDQRLIEKKITSAEYVRRNNLPKAMFVDFPPPRRLCDLAVTGFIKKFNPKISFKLRSGNYSAKEVAEIRDLMKEKFSANQTASIAF